MYKKPQISWVVNYYLDQGFLINITTEIGKEEAKLSLFTNSMILYIENPNISTKNLINQWNI